MYLFLFYCFLFVGRVRFWNIQNTTSSVELLPALFGRNLQPSKQIKRGGFQEIAWLRLIDVAVSVKSITRGNTKSKCL